MRLVFVLLLVACAQSVACRRHGQGGASAPAKVGARNSSSSPDGGRKSMTPMLIKLTGTRALFLSSGTPIPGLDVDTDHGLGPVGHQNDDPQPTDIWSTFANASD